MDTTTIPSFIRTYVVLFVAWLVGWLLSLGITVDDSAKNLLIGGLSALVAAVYYAVIRVLERRFPTLGFLLGSNKVPVSVDPTLTPAQQRPQLIDAIAVAAKGTTAADDPPQFE